MVERDQVPPVGISTRRPIETTTPNFVRATQSQKRNDDKIYDGCGDTKTCFGSPDNCVQTKSCETFSAVIVRGDLRIKAREMYIFLKLHFMILRRSIYLRTEIIEEGRICCSRSFG